MISNGFQLFANKVFAFFANLASIKKHDFLGVSFSFYIGTTNIHFILGQKKQ